jgi:transcriptional regulator with XRE-family HTH domain
MATLGQRLKELRLEKHMTQAEIGKYLNVSNVSVSGYENDTREPDSAALIKLADLYGVSLDYMHGRTDDRHGDDDDLTDNQKLIAYSIDPDVSAEERDAIIEMVKQAMKFKKRI